MKNIENFIKNVKIVEPPKKLENKIMKEIKKNVLKKGDAVQFEYRDKYDRETGIGIIVNVEEDNFYRVVLIEGKDGDYCFTNYEASLPIGKLKSLNKTNKNYGLEV